METFLIIAACFIVFLYFLGEDEDSSDNNTEGSFERIGRGMQKFNAGLEEHNAFVKRHKTASELTFDLEFNVRHEIKLLEIADRQTKVNLSVFNMYSDKSRAEALALFEKQVKALVDSAREHEPPGTADTQTKFEPYLATKPISNDHSIQELINSKYADLFENLDSAYKSLQAEASRDQEYAVELKNVLTQYNFPNNKIERIFKPKTISPPVRKPLPAALSSANNFSQKTTEPAPKHTSTLQDILDSKSSKAHNISAVHTGPFTSKNRKTHLRLTVKDSSATADAIIWEGDWDERLRTRLDSGAKFSITARPSHFNGKTSLVIEEIDLDANNGGTR